jgi:hypothetical protein
MASSTSPDNIVYPDASDPIAPLNAVFQDLAESVQDALDNITPGAEALDDLTDVEITTPADGDLLVYDDGDWVNKVPSGSILQVVRATDTTQRSTTSATYTDVTGMAVTITPQRSSSAVLIVASCNVTNLQTVADFSRLQITDSSNNAISGAEEADFGAFNYTVTGTAQFAAQMTIIGYVTPGVTSAVTFKLRFRTPAGTVRVNNDVQTGQMYAIEVAA